MSGSINNFLLGDILISSTTDINASIGDNLSGTAYAEYFLDSVSDPGLGSATPMAVSGNSATATVSLSGLSPGQHELFYRSRDVAGNWSTTNSTLFTYIGF
jgi:hypothetical protein